MRPREPGRRAAPARIFVYLPAGDLERSAEFFATLGFALRPEASVTASRTHVATEAGAPSAEAPRQRRGAARNRG